MSEFLLLPSCSAIVRIMLSAQLYPLRKLNTALFVRLSLLVCKPPSDYFVETKGIKGNLKKYGVMVDFERYFHELY